MNSRLEQRSNCIEANENQVPPFGEGSYKYRRGKNAPEVLGWHWRQQKELMIFDRQIDNNI